MAVALATLPLKSLLAGDGDMLLTTGAGAGLAATTAGLAGLAAGLAALGATAGLPAAPPGTLLFLFCTAALLTTGLLITTFLTAAFFGAGFFRAAFFRAVFFTATFFTANFFTATFLTTVFFAAAFLAAGLAADATFLGRDLATAFPTAGLTTFLPATDLAANFFAAAFFAAAFFATSLPAGLPAGFVATRLVFAVPVLAFFTIRPFVAAVFGVPALATTAPALVLTFCALAAVELALVFAISLHRGWPWRPGVIAHVFYTSKSASGILVPLHAANRSSNVNILTRLILWLLRLYKRWLSPLLGPSCRFHPTCSDYARIAVIRFGPWRGSLLAGWRLLRCQPLCSGGEDPVPEHFHYPRCRCAED